MYFIIKRDKAEHFDNKLRKVKETVCDILEELRDIRTKEYTKEDLYDSEHSRHDARHREHDRDYDHERGRSRYDDEDEYYERDNARRGRGRIRY